VTDTVLLAGNPNSGKTTLFNALTGSRARTGNYPGVTVERRVGTWTLGDREVELVDLPGAYSLAARSREEAVAIEAIVPAASRSAPAALVVVADSGNLERHLYFALQLLELGLPTVIALSLADEAKSRGITVDTARLSERLRVPIVSVSARRREGFAELARAVSAVIRAGGASSPIRLALDPDVEADVAAFEAKLPGDGPRRRGLALATILSAHAEPDALPPGLAVREARALVEAAAAAGRRLAESIVVARYAAVDRALDGLVTRASSERSTTARLDAVLTHPALGLLVFAAVMAVLFQALFAWSEPLVGGIETLVAGLQDLTRSALPTGPLADLLVDGVIAGAGNVIVFVPQIAILSLFLVFLEDSGYLARVALVIDRLMGAVGLNGKAFVPLLSGFACAVPAVIATRTIESRRDRLLTMLALPLMSCSARLPVYTLVVAIAFPAGASSFGVSHGAIALFAMYALSVIGALGAAAVLRRTVLPGQVPTMILELPPYRWPVPRNLVREAGERVAQFLGNAGSVIVAITIVLWALLHLPGDAAAEAVHARAVVEAEALEGEARDARIAELDAALAEANMQASVGGRIGRALEPAIEPLGFDWKIGIGLLASFAAREVLVSTLGIVYGVGDEADEESEPLRARLLAARRPDGTPVFTPLVGVSLMIFFVFAAQCMSTLAIVRRESGSWRWALFMLVYMNVLAYGASLAVFQGGRLLGFA
jgi:ferrous iron transport protein B